jgi:pimeloyl-ACP methyl ester carboxylesterase
VLVHGLGGTSGGIWRHLAPDLAGDFTVVTFDLRGTGGSARTAGRYSLDDFVGDLRAVVASAGLEQPALVGHSLGGSIVLAYAARHPEEVAALVAIAGPVLLPEQGRQAMRDRAETVESSGMAAVAETVATNGMAPAFRKRRPEDLRAFVELLEANDPAAYAATCRVLAELDLRPELERIVAPVLLIAGERDGVTPPAALAEIERALRNVRRVEVADTAHMLPWERPDVLAREVRSFLLAHRPVTATPSGRRRA